MKFLRRFRVADAATKQYIAGKVRSHAAADFDFIFFLTLGTLIATIGMRLGNPFLVFVGSLVAPALYPVLALGLGAALPDGKLLHRSLYALVKASAISAFIVFFVSLFLKGWAADPTAVLLFYREPSFLYFLAALFAGFAVPYAMAKKYWGPAPSWILSVLLVPPLAAFCVGLADGSAFMTTGALGVLFWASFGAVGGAITAFSFMEFNRSNPW